MKRSSLRLLGILMLAGLSGCVVSRRSITVAVPMEKVDITYSVAWGWGMEERLSIAPEGSLFSSVSTNWEDIWGKPYNSGMTVYRSKDGQFLYIGLSIRLYRYDVEAGTMTAFCHSRDAVAFTPLGQQLAAVSFTEHEAIDPQRQERLDYVDPVLKGEISASPPQSRYYSGLEYLGRFGVERAKGRGSDVGFEPSDKVSEPRLGLGGTCG
ncbi:hypothetical protein [Shinella kummerowiae]|uniref:hypothetical protein n=1 Tax=Shinella kummerowiae TaxID=417745 RepID=UPI0021B66E06|nr:hypothetical protein [Shinella kummerowiae]MCT7667120.1 hypothetical protein [Shinella kummerowiae]